MAGYRRIPGRLEDQSFPAKRTAISLSAVSQKHVYPETFTGAVPLIKALVRARLLRRRQAAVGVSRAQALGGWF